MEGEAGEDSDIATPKAESAMRTKYLEKAAGAPFTNLRVSSLGNTSKSTPEGSEYSDEDNFDDDDDDKYAVPSRMTLKHQSQALAELNKSGEAVKTAPKKKGALPVKKQ